MNSEPRLDKPGVPSGRKLLINRNLVSQILEPQLLAMGQINIKESINWVLIPEDLVIYVSTRNQQEVMKEAIKEEGTVLLRSNGKKL